MIRKHIITNIQQSGRFFGWQLLVLLWGLYLNMICVYYGASVLNAYMSKSLNIPRDDYGFGVGLSLLVLGVLSPVTGWLVRKFGARKVLVLGTSVQALGALLLGLIVQSSFGFILVYGLLIGAGASLGGLVPTQTIVSHWFSKKRSLATAVMFSAGGIGGIGSTWIISTMIERYSYTHQHGWVLLSGFSMLFCLLTWLFMIEKPEDVGQSADGVFVSKELDEVHPVSNTSYGNRWTVKKVFSHPTIWLILVGTLAITFSYESTVAHAVVYLMDRQVPNEIASITVGLLALASIGGRLFAGVLCEKMQEIHVIAIGSLLIAASIPVLMIAESLSVVVLFSILIGVGCGLVLVPQFTILPEYYGLNHLTEIMGVVLMIGSGISAFAVAFAGWVKETNGGYTVFWYISIAISLIGFLFILFAKRPSRTN